MSDERDDRELIDAYIRDRRPDDFGELAERHAGRIFAICFKFTGNRADALDASQEVYVRLLRKIHLYDGSSAFSTWLHRVAVNVCYDFIRARTRAPGPVEELPEPIDLSSSSEMSSVEMKPLIEEALRLMPPEYRVPVVLRDVEGWSYEEIADSLDLPGGTVRSRIHRGRKLLASYLGNLSDDESRQTDEPRRPREKGSGVAPERSAIGEEET